MNLEGVVNRKKENLRIFAKLLVPHESYTEDFAVGLRIIA